MQHKASAFFPNLETSLKILEVRSMYTWASVLNTYSDGAVSCCWLHMM